MTSTSTSPRGQGRGIDIIGIVGARPNFMKMAAIAEAAKRREGVNFQLLHTGQHYSPEMSKLFFDDLGLPKPAVNLEVGPGSEISQVAGIMQRLEPVLAASRPDLVLVVGDVSSTVAAAMAAAKLHIPLAHVEAGLRSLDRSMPEELNRVVTDALSDYLFASEPGAVANLLREGVPENRIFLAGNVMIDTLVRFRSRAHQSDILLRMGVKPKQFGLMTLHRPSNVDDPAVLKGLIQAADRISSELPIVFPVHPRTEKMMREQNIGAGRLIVSGPLGYLDFLCLMDHARLVLTDSGGIQEETTALGVPCLTLRKTTERPITVEQGTNTLVGIDPAAVMAAAMAALTGAAEQGRVPDLWDGCASERILNTLQGLDEIVPR